MSKSDDSIEILVKRAISAIPSAYAPYSGFQVGAAILDSEGDIYTGVNVENASYPEGDCAEASAITAMVAGGGRRIVALAVAGRGDLLCTPCGGCRQRIREFADGDVPIIICGEGGERARFRLEDLLPYSFGPDHLG